MSREKDLVKNTIIISFGTFIPKLASIITLPIITAGLSKAEYGTYDLINTLVSLFLPVLTLQIQSAAFRFLIEKRQDEKEKSKIISTILTFITITSAVGLLVLFFSLRNLSVETRLFICLYFYFDMYVLTMAQIIRGINKNKIYSTNAILQSIVNMTLIIVTVKWKKIGLNGVILSIGIACFCSCVFLLSFGQIYRYYTPRQFSKKTLKKMLQYSWPMIPNQLSLWVMNISDRLILTTFLGVEVNAVYAVANKIPSLFSIVQNTFTYAWQENASVNSNDADATNYYSKIFDQVYCILVGVMAVLIATTPILFSLLIRGDYSDSYNQMPILFLGVFFSTISSFLGGIYIAKKRTKSVGITTTFAAFMNFAINMLFVRKIGIYAASISTTVSYMFLVIYRMFDVQKFMKLKFQKLKMGITLLILVCMCVLCFQRNNILNIVNIFISVTMGIFININKLKSIAKKILISK